MNESAGKLITGRLLKATQAISNKLIFLSVIFFLSFIEVFGHDQNGTLQIGKKCPDFKFTDISYFAKTSASLDEFKGKWLILDFWTMGCGNCFTKFPENNEMQKKYKERLQVILVGYNQSITNLGIRQIYEKLRKKDNLNLPVAWDTAVFNRWGIVGVPFVVVIDPEGIVRGITYDLKIAAVTEFLQGKQPFLKRAYTSYDSARKGANYNFDAPILVNNNGGEDSDFVFRSLISKWNNQMPLLLVKHLPGQFEALGMDLSALYMTAFCGRPSWGDWDTALYGKYYAFPVLDLQDSSEFRSDIQTGLNMYAYTLEVPRGRDSLHYLLGIMRSALKAYFGYQVDVEMRQMPYYKLVMLRGVRDSLKTKGAKPTYEDRMDGVTVLNYPIDKLDVVITSHLGYHFRTAILNETGFSGNIDLTLHAFMNDFGEVQRALRANGLLLVPEKKLMSVIVIRDKRPA